MKNINKIIRRELNDCIYESVRCGQLFLKNPKSDFSRKRKLPLDDMVKFSLCMAGGSLPKELYRYFNYGLNTATTSAFIQQNDKILPEFYRFLLHNFTSRIDCPTSFFGYTLLACDGSSVRIRTEPSDTETFIKSKETCGYNAIHLNALYDLNNHIYTDVHLQNAIGSETASLVHMVKTGTFNHNTIIMADRGYECYNVFANIEQQNMFYLIRIKDVGSNGGILHKYHFPDNKEFDTYIEPIITKKNTNKVKYSKENYVRLKKNDIFDFVDLHTNYYYPMKIRIARIEIEPNKYECIATNLPKDKFPPSIIKKLYAKRWGIETSFGILKYKNGLENLHFKKLDSILKEIYCRLVMFNYNMAIVNAIIINNKAGLYLYKPNISLAIEFCRNDFKNNDDSINVVGLIQKNIIPIRPNRHFERKFIPKKEPCFQYRIAA